MLQPGLRCRLDIAQTTHVGAECRLWLNVLTELRGPLCVSRVKALTVFGYFTAILLPKNKIHRKYVHLKNAFFDAENEKKTKFGQLIRQTDRRTELVGLGLYLHTCLCAKIQFKPICNFVIVSLQLKTDTNMTKRLKLLNNIT